MRTMTGQNSNAAEIDLTCEFDLNAAAAVVTTRGDLVTAVRTGVGTYTVTYKGTDGVRMYEILGNGPNIRAASAVGNVQGVQIISIIQGGGTYNDDIVVTVVTKTNVPAIADTTSAMTVCVWFAFRGQRMGNPL